MTIEKNLEFDPVYKVLCEAEVYYKEQLDAGEQYPNDKHGWNLGPFSGWINSKDNLSDLRNRIMPKWRYDEFFEKVKGCSPEQYERRVEFQNRLPEIFQPFYKRLRL